MPLPRRDPLLSCLAVTAASHKDGATLVAREHCRSHHHEGMDKGKSCPSRTCSFFPVLSPESFILRFQKSWKRSISGIISASCKQNESSRAELGSDKPLPSLDAPIPLKTLQGANVSNWGLQEESSMGHLPSCCLLQNQDRIREPWKGLDWKRS